MLEVFQKDFDFWKQAVSFHMLPALTEEHFYLG